VRAVGAQSPQGEGLFSLLLTTRRTLRLWRRRRRNGRLEVCSGGVRRKSAQEVAPRMRKKRKLQGKAFWLGIVLVKGVEHLGVTDQLELSITSSSTLWLRV
jgi:hypothetical protein